MCGVATTMRSSAYTTLLDLEETRSSTSCGRIRWSSAGASSSRIRSSYRRRSFCTSSASGEPNRTTLPERRPDMDAQPEHSAEEIKRLQRCINDLVSVLALPAIWRGRDASQIVQTLLDVLLALLRLDFVYARLKDPVGGGPIEMVRVAKGRKLTARPDEIGAELNRSLGPDPQTWAPLARCRIGDGDLSVVPLRLALQNEIGVVVAGSQRADFPGQTESLVLSVAANQAAIGLQEARLLGEQKRIADELDQRVAQRTAELSAANDKLKKEIAERRRAEEDLHATETNFSKFVESFPGLLVTMSLAGE